MLARAFTARVAGVRTLLRRRTGYEREFVNNRLKGDAPGTIEGVVSELKRWHDSRRPSNIGRGTQTDAGGWMAYRLDEQRLLYVTHVRAII
jgi:hypothetical protein